MWEYRRQALEALEGPLRNECAVIDAGFSLLDVSIKRFAAQPSQNAYARTYALILVKAKHFAFGCFSLTLDGLGQEAGALLRLSIEAVELLHYLSTDSSPPSRFEQIWRGSLPSSGNIAKKIGGHFHGLRNMLSDTASHFRMKPEATRHVVDSATGEIKGEQVFSESVVRSNLATCFYFLYFLGVEAFVALGASGVANEDVGAQVDALLAAGQRVFPPPPVV
jgi:hypothetical protein